jgi:hypothetical protein
VLSTTDSTSRQWRHSDRLTSGPSGVNRNSCPVLVSNTVWLTRVISPVGTRTAASPQRSIRPSSVWPVMPPAR